MVKISKAVQPLVDALGYEQDPLWQDHYSKLFQGIENYKQTGKVGKNLNSHVNNLIDNFKHENDRLGRCTLYSFEQEGYISINGAKIEVLKPLRIDNIGEHNPILDITAPACFEKGVTLSRVTIDAPTYICEDTKVENTSIQDQKKGNFIGPRSTVSNTPEVRGTFVGSDCYVHALNTGNMIIGSASGIGRCHVQNHSIIQGNSTIVDPETLEVITTEYRHIPTFIGRNVEIVGYGTVLTGGTIIGKYSKLDHNLNIDGYVWNDQGRIKYKSKHPVMDLELVK